MKIDAFSRLTAAGWLANGNKARNITIQMVAMAARQTQGFAATIRHRHLL
ncbi:MAG: hypothetical protein U0989_09340 [Azonexus sp.]|nr:hypothetical protein [Azonexus sp.]